MALFSIGPNLDQTAQDWINGNVPAPSLYQGTLTALAADQTQWAQLCGSYVHQQNFTINKSNATAACLSKIKNLYQGTEQALQGQEVADINNLKNAGDNSTLYAVIALVIIVMVIVVLILKM